MPLGAWPPLRGRDLWFERGEISGCSQQIIWPEVGDYCRHKRRPSTRSVAILHVLELTRNVERRAAGESWNGSQTAEIKSVACRAGGDLRPTGSQPVLDQGFALLDAPGWHIGNEARMWVAENVGVIPADRRFDNALAQRLGAGIGPCKREEHPRRF